MRVENYFHPRLFEKKPALTENSPIFICAWLGRFISLREPAAIRKEREFSGKWFLQAEHITF
jgi:hypothetical protein